MGGTGERHYFTSESVTEGHPDKLCDQISDAVLDAYLREDPDARVACETVATGGLVFIFGEISSTARVDVANLARQVIRDVGYTDPAYGCDTTSCAVLVSLKEQSPDIAMGVNRAWEARDQGADDEVERVGAGDQGMVFGFAVNETPTFMPLPIDLAHRLARRLAEVRKSGLLTYLRPDGKTQVTVEYEGQNPVRVDTIVISAQHDPDVPPEVLRADLLEHVVGPVVPSKFLDDRTRFFINPTGRFVIGGPQGDAGLTGRKVIVDTYGGYSRHGGGAFSGKDPTKVDRSAAYAARYVAKNIVAAGLADRAEVQISYAIGVAQPISIRVDTYGTGRLPDAKLVELVHTFFDLRPGAIIRDFELRRPIYRHLATYGHFGREDLDVPWERTDRAEALRHAAEAWLSAPGGR